jgi:hypothetical protein
VPMERANGVACVMVLGGKRCRRRFVVVLGSEVHLHPRFIPGIGIVEAYFPNEASSQVSRGRGKNRTWMAYLTWT